MLTVETKLLDFKDQSCVGVVCVNGNTRVALSIDKAKELGVEDIGIIDYLDTHTEEVVLHTRRAGFFAYKDKAKSRLDNFIDEPYELLGDVRKLSECDVAIFGYVFSYFSFLELDNELAIKKALVDAEAE